MDGQVAHKVSTTALIGPGEPNTVRMGFTASSSSFDMVLDKQGSPCEVTGELQSAMVWEESDVTKGRVAWFPQAMMVTMDKTGTRDVMVIRAKECQVEMTADVLLKMTQVSCIEGSRAEGYNKVTNIKVLR